MHTPARMVQPYLLQEPPGLILLALRLSGPAIQPEPGCNAPALLLLQLLPLLLRAAQLGLTFTRRLGCNAVP